MNINELRQRQADAHESALALINRAEAEKRDLLDEESREVDAHNAEFDRLDKQINQVERIQGQSAALSETLGRKSEPEHVSRTPANRSDDDHGDDAPAKPRFNNAARASQSGARPRIDFTNDNPKGKWGWRNFGEFARGVMQASNKAAPSVDNRFVNAPTTYGQEGVGADGGFAVPPEFRTAIMEKVLGEDALLSRTDLQNTSSNTLVIPTDETTPWQTTGGIQAYWGSEGAAKTPSKPSLGQTQITLNKLYCLVPVTDELLEDAPGLDGYLRRKAPEKINFKVNLSLVNGTGVGQPLGVLNSPATVTVSKETSQAADTIQFENIQKMWSRLYAPLRRNAVWLVNQDVEPQLSGMSLTIGVGGIPVYMPAGGISVSPYSTLFGRPVIPTQACETLGDKGDVILGDWSMYLAAQKSGGIKTDVSMHLWFDYDVTAFRFVMRVGGQPWWNGDIDPRDGSNSLGAFVTLAERA